MFKRNIILFFIKHKQKIIKLCGFILALLFIAFVASIAFKIVATFNDNEESSENVKLTNEKQQTLIYGTDISEEEYTEDEEVIDNFINYCNNKKIKQAYNLITDSCKKAYYPTQKDFESLYYEPIFNTKNNYEIQSWISSNAKNTYQIKIMPDLFDKGIYSSDTYVEDYYTVINEDDQKKISINKYIDKNEINKQVEQEGLNINIVNKDVYMEYEIYTIEIQNKTEKDIVIDSKETTKGIYLLDNSDVRYSSFIHELSISDLIINAKNSKTIKIKFNKYYNPDNDINRIVFNDIIKDYEKYKTVNNYTDRMSITVQMN